MSQRIEVELNLIDSLSKNMESVERSTSEHLQNMESSIASTGQAFQDVGEQFSKTQKVIESSISGISNADAQALTIAKTTAAMRAAMRKESAADAIKTAEKEAETLARLRAKQEQEFLRVDAQARAAEAASTTTFFQRKIAVEKESHATRLQALAGNDEAMEAEVRRHEAVITRLQSEGMMQVDRSTRMVVQRFGRLGNQFNSLQMAFMGVGSAAGEVDGKFGQVIGRTALMTSGLIGMAQTIEVAKSSFGGLGLAMGGTLAVVALVGTAIGLLIEHQKELKALSKENNWFGDPGQYAQVIAAISAYDAAQKELNATTSNAYIGMGIYTGMLVNHSAAALQATDATKKLQEITGLTRDELVKLYGNLQQAQEGWKLVADQRIIQANYDLQRSLVALEEDGIRKNIDLQKIANNQALSSIREHYEAIKLDTKKTTAEKLKAKEDEGRELAIREKTNQALMEAAAKKEPKSEKSEDEAHNRTLESQRAFQEKWLAMVKHAAVEKQLAKEDEARTELAYAKKDQAVQKIIRDTAAAAMKDGVPKQLALSKAREQDEVAEAKKKAKELGANAEQAQQIITNIERRHSEERILIARAENEAKISAGIALTNNIGEFMKIAAGKNKAMAIAGMRVTEAGAIASTAAGVAKAFEQSGIYGFLTGAAIGVAGGTQVATIEQQISKLGGGFRGGGYTGDGSPGDVAGFVHRKEYVVKESVVSRMGGPDGVERALSKGGGETHIHLHEGDINIGGNADSSTVQAIKVAKNKTLREQANQIKLMKARGML